MVADSTRKPAIMNIRQHVRRVEIQPTTRSSSRLLYRSLHSTVAIRGWRPVAIV
jgi:hypothetical protein